MWSNLLWGSQSDEGDAASDTIIIIMLRVAPLQYQNRFMVYQPMQGPHMHGHALANVQLHK